LVRCSCIDRIIARRGAEVARIRNNAQRPAQQCYIGVEPGDIRRWEAWLDGFDGKSLRLHEASIAFKYCSAVVRDRRASFSDPPDLGRKHCRTIATSEW
jgi:hypothetical protein